MSSNLWAIVLAGGCGTRLASESVRRYGYARPKQFCDFDGRGTLLQQTIDRATLSVPEDRVVVVTTRACRREARESLDRYPRVVHVEQPVGRDTAPGLLLPLLAVLRADPDSLVVVMPSDHHVASPTRFAQAVGRAARTADAHPHDVVLLGADPDAPEEGYGWIEPAWGGRVARFVEKPDRSVVEWLIAHGALINTFVMVGKARAFSGLLARWAPQWWEAVGADAERATVVERAYATLPAVNFSEAVLAPAIRHLRVERLGAVGWTDVGTPGRLQQALDAAAQASP
jgi:mannose-1-phosphate guanylyltransferase